MLQGHSNKRQSGKARESQRKPSGALSAVGLEIKGDLTFQERPLSPVHLRFDDKNSFMKVNLMIREPPTTYLSSARKRAATTMYVRRSPRLIEVESTCSLHAVYHRELLGALPVHGRQVPPRLFGTSMHSAGSIRQWINFVICKAPVFIIFHLTVGAEVDGWMGGTGGCIPLKEVEIDMMPGLPVAFTSQRTSQSRL